MLWSQFYILLYLHSDPGDDQKFVDLLYLDPQNGFLHSIDDLNDIGNPTIDALLDPSQLDDVSTDSSSEDSTGLYKHILAQCNLYPLQYTCFIEMSCKSNTKHSIKKFDLQIQV